jgi:tetratricopeptide (TPR) repeat protein
MRSPHFYYFDLLVVNQYGADALVPFETLRDTFAAGVLDAGRTLLVLDETASAMGRLWCVFELAVSLQHSDRVSFEVIMAPRHAAAFRTQLVRDYDSVVRRTMSVDVENARAREAADETNIRCMLQAPGLGYLRANQLVIGAMKEWMVAEARAALAALSPEERHGSTLPYYLSRLLQAMGQLAEADPLAREALATRRRVLGDEHPDTLASINNVAQLLQAMDRLAEAEPLAREALATRRRVLGDAHPDTLTSVFNLAQLQYDMGNTAEAMALFSEELVAMRHIHGDAHPDTQTSLRNLVSLLESQGRSEEAAALRTLLIAQGAGN